MSSRAGPSLVALVCSAFTAGCSDADPTPTPLGPLTNTGHPAGPAYFIDFRVPRKLNEEGNPEGLWISNYEFVNDFANVAWTSKNITFGPEGMRITARHERKGKSPYTSGEVQVEGFYGYGRYEWTLRTAPGLGLDSAAFLHTYDGMDGDPHDEIDFEFPGLHPRRVHLNYFRNGKPFGSIWVDLNYDPAQEIHLYAFDWRPDSIRWYIDGRLVAEKVRPPELQIPYTTQRPIMNLLVAGKDMQPFTGPIDFKSGVSMLVTCTSHVPMGATGRQCSDLPDRGGAPAPAQMSQR